MGFYRCTSKLNTHCSWRQEFYIKNGNLYLVIFNENFKFLALNFLFKKIPKFPTPLFSIFTQQYEWVIRKSFSSINLISFALLTLHPSERCQWNDDNVTILLPSSSSSYADYHHDDDKFYDTQLIINFLFVVFCFFGRL